MRIFVHTWIVDSGSDRRRDGMTMYNKVEICGVNTATLKVLTEADKIRLLRAMRAGDAGAREQLVNGNLRLVLSVIQRTGRESGRSVSGGVHRSDQGDR